MDIPFYKYHGTGNDFILIDNRDDSFPIEQPLIEKLCDRRFGIGADGLILLKNHDTYDFDMQYFNSDGNESTMCGNGGRCVVSFASKLGIIDNTTTFNACDGVHHAILNNKLIELSMSDVDSILTKNDIFLLNTGSPQAVLFITDLKTTDVFKTGSIIRNDKNISEKGVNVNFVEIIASDEINVRTFERGVEGETWSCGTGSVASAIISYLKNDLSLTNCSITVNVKGGKLKVSFETTDRKSFTNIKLTGPATPVFSGKVSV